VAGAPWPHLPQNPQMRLVRLVRLATTAPAKQAKNTFQMNCLSAFAAAFAARSVTRIAFTGPSAAGMNVGSRHDVGMANLAGGQCSRSTPKASRIITFSAS
jgi:hypothetical protein